MSTSLEIKDDPKLYPSRWLALHQGHIIAFGQSREQAYRAAKASQAKVAAQFAFVDELGTVHPQPKDYKPWLRHPFLQKIIQALPEAGPPVYLVGGLLRDGLLGQIASQADVDLAVPWGQGLRLARHLADTLDGAYYPLDEERDVGRVVFSERLQVDVAAFRGESLLQDLEGRDFRINAIALELNETDPKLLDPLGGQADLHANYLELAGPQAINDDPVRVLRALRMQYDYDLDLSPALQQALQEQGKDLESLSLERFRDEFLKLLQVPQPSRAFLSMRELGLLGPWFPELAALCDVPQSPPHHWPVFEHTLAVLDACQEVLNFADPRLAIFETLRPELEAYFEAELAGQVSRYYLMPLAALLHDIGKPDTFKAVHPGKISFWNHAQKGAEISSRLLQTWRLSTQVQTFIKRLVLFHMRPMFLQQQDALLNQALHDFIEAAGDATPAIGFLALADYLGRVGPEADPDEWEALTKTVFLLCEAYFIPDPVPLLDGARVMQVLNLAPGPNVGRVLRELHRAQKLGEVLTEAEALDFIQKIALGE